MPQEHKTCLRQFFNSGWSNLTTSKTFTCIMSVTHFTTYSWVIPVGLFLARDGNYTNTFSFNFLLCVILNAQCCVTVTIGAIASEEANYYIIPYHCFETSIVHICQQFLLLGRMAYNWYWIHTRAWIFQSFTSITGSPPKNQATLRTTTSVTGLLQTMFQLGYRLTEKTAHITHKPYF